jgi:hypothetical protein
MLDCMKIVAYNRQLYMGKKTRRIKTDNYGNKYVHSYGHHYDKEKKKTIQDKGKYLGVFDGTYDKDGNPNFIPSRSGQSVELKKFWDIVQLSIEHDIHIKNKKSLYFLIQNIITNPKCSMNDLLTLLDKVENKEFLKHTLINPSLDKACLSTPFYYSSWDDSLKGYKILLMNRKTEEFLQFTSPSYNEITKKLKYGFIPIISGDTGKLIETKKYDSSSEFIIIGRDYITEELLPLWFKAHDFFVYTHEIHPYKNELMLFLRRINFLEQIKPVIWYRIFGDAINSLLDPADFHGLIEVLTIKIYNVFSTVKELDFMLIKKILEENSQFVKIRDKWILLDERVTLSQKQ